MFWLHCTLSTRWKRGWIAALGDVGNAEALTWLSQLGYYYCGILCLYSIRKCSKFQRASFVLVMTGHLLCWATENVTVATALLRWWLASQQVPAWYGQCGLRTVSLPDLRSAVIWRSTNDAWHSCACITKSNKKLLTLSPPIPLRFYTLSYWSNPPFLIFDIRVLWRSGLSARAPECQKLKMAGYTSMVLNPSNSSNLEQLALKGLKQQLSLDYIILRIKLKLNLHIF